MNILEKSLAILFLTGSLYWLFALGRVIYNLIANKIQEGKERYAYEHREIVTNTWPQMQVTNNLREQVRELTAKLDITQDRMDGSNKRNRELEAENKSLSDTFDKSAETVRAQMVEITKLRDGLAAYDKSVPRWTTPGGNYNPDWLKSLNVMKMEAELRGDYKQDPETGCAIMRDAQEINFEKMEYRLTRIEAILPPIIELPTKARTVYTADWGKFIESNRFVNGGIVHKSDKPTII